MECPKCHKKIEESATVCPYCHKVLSLVCPNCRTIGNSPVCENCGYIILQKCSKCGKMVSTEKETCKCGFPVSKSIAYQECETDEFASMIVKFQGLKTIQASLKSKELYAKFKLKLKNILSSLLKNVDGKVITYGDMFVINLNKELSLQTSAHKAVRLSLKILNSYTFINTNVLSEFGKPLNLTVTIVRKSSDDLLKSGEVGTNIKLLNSASQKQKYLRGMQIILDQDIRDIVEKEYKSDSLFTLEQDHKTIMFYEIILEDYILPPGETQREPEPEAKLININKKKKENPNDIYSFKVFDISAKCDFIKSTAETIFDKLDDKKIISLRSKQEYEIKTENLVNYYTKQNKKILRAVCNEENQYKSWGVFDQLIRDFYNLSPNNEFVDKNSDKKPFPALYNLILEKNIKSSSSEDARFAYFESFSRFLSSLENYVILIEGFEYIDDSTVQALSLYFDKFKKITPTFVFTTNDSVSVHSKIKGLLQTAEYREVTVIPSSTEEILSDIKEDATDFIQSFYFEKITENYDGSCLYFDNALRFLTEKGVLINFEDKLLLRSNASVLLPTSLNALLKARLKYFGSKYQASSMILAFSTYLGPKLDFQMLEKLGIPDLKQNLQNIIDAGFGYVRENALYLNNYNILKTALQSSLKHDTEEFLCKTIFAKIGQGLDNTTTAIILGCLGIVKEEYLVLWKNSRFAMDVGDFDAYLKNCLGFLSLIDKLSDKISKEDIETNKKEIFENILMSLYSYSPDKIYSIENVLLMDAFKENDDEKIVKLSNLMLQGALISSNYTDAVSLIYNILTRMKNPTLIVNEQINTKFLLLSLVNIEILFNIGDYRRCIEIAEELLGVIEVDKLETITPAGFSTNFFITHLMETFRMVAFAKVIVLDEDLENFFDLIHKAFEEDLPDKDCVIALRDFLRGKSFAPSNTENATSFEKAVFLIIQQFAETRRDYKNFAQNCYQAKLLATDIHQTQIERLCDILIAYSYGNIGIKQKAEAIYKDVIEKSEKSAIFMPLIIAKYYLAKLKAANDETDEALLLVNDALALIQKGSNQAKLFYAILEKLFIELAENNPNLPSTDINSEIQKLISVAPNGELNRIIGDLQTESALNEIETSSDELI